MLGDCPRRSRQPRSPEQPVADRWVAIGIVFAR